jgi:hypothetical protein
MLIWLWQGYIGVKAISIKPIYDIDETRFLRSCAEQNGCFIIITTVLVKKLYEINCASAEIELIL